jgi:hypothetical protein
MKEYTEKNPDKLVNFLIKMPLDLLAPKTFLIIWFSNLSILSVPDEGYS